MKVKNGDIWAARTGLAALRPQNLPVKSVYWLGRLGDVLNPHIQKLGDASRQIMRNHNWTSIQSSSPEWVPFWEEFGPLLEIEVELDLPFAPIKLPDSFRGSDGIEHEVYLSQQDVLGLRPFVAFPEPNGAEPAKLEAVK